VDHDDSPWLIILLVEGRRSIVQGLSVISVRGQRCGDGVGDLAEFRREFYGWEQENRPRGHKRPRPAKLFAML